MNKRKKFMLYGVLTLVVATVIFIGDKLFTKVDMTETSIEVYKASMDIPTAVKNFEMNLKSSDSAEMLKHYDVKGKGSNSNIFGYVQIWQSDQPLAHYMKISKEYMSANVFAFREGEVKVNGIIWKKWDYIVNSVAVSQGFFEKKGKIYLCSMCVPYQEKTYEFDRIFLELLESAID